MACTLHPPSEAVPGALQARPMTHCECAEVSFAEVARQMAAHRFSLEEAVRRAGCGQTCTACLPDLLRYLASV